MSALEKIKGFLKEERLKKERAEFHAKMRRLDIADKVAEVEALVIRVFREFDGVNGLEVTGNSIYFKHIKKRLIHTEIVECRLGDELWFALEVHQSGLGFDRIPLEEVTIEKIEDVVAIFMKNIFSDYDFEKGGKL